MTPNKTQLQQVRTHLSLYGNINSWTAITKYRITRLSQYILLLRKDGLDIEMKRIKTDNKSWCGQYTLVK